MGGKMTKKWDGPYEVTAITKKHTYELTHCDTGKVYGRKVPAIQLKPFHQRHLLQHSDDSDAEDFFGKSVPLDSAVTPIKEALVPDTQLPTLPQLTSSFSVPETQLEGPQEKMKSGPVVEKHLPKWKEGLYKSPMERYLQDNYPDMLKFPKVLEEERIMNVTLPPALQVEDETRMHEIIWELEEDDEAMWRYLSFKAKTKQEVNNLIELARSKDLRGILFAEESYGPLHSNSESDWETGNDALEDKKVLLRKKYWFKVVQ